MKTTTLTTLTTLAAGSLLAMAGIASAQPTPGNATQTYQGMSQRDAMKSLLDQYKDGTSAPELHADETKDLGPQSILKLKPRRTHFEVSTESQYFYTSNMGLTEDTAATKPIPTGVLVNSAQFALAPTPYEIKGRKFAPRLGYRHQWFNYGLEDASGTLNNFDFDVQTLFLDGRYAIAENWVVEAGVDWTRLLGHNKPNYNEFYKELTPRWGLTRFFPISERQAVTVAYQGVYHSSKVDPAPHARINDRLDQILMASYTHVFNQHLVAQPFYRFQYTSYTGRGIDRNDLLHTIGLSIGWNLCPRASLRAFVSYDHRESDNVLVQDYRKVDAGGGLSLNYRF
jgi:hypothetical protein